MRSRPRGWSICLFASALGVACGSTPPSGFGEDTTGAAPQPAPSSADDPGSSTTFGDTQTGLVVEPSNATVFIDTATTPATPATLDYKLVLKGGPNGDQDLTSSATFTAKNPALGAFTGAKFTSVDLLPGNVRGVTTQIEAKAPNGAGVANLTLVQLRKTGPQRDFFFIVPYNEQPSPTSDVLTFQTKIQQVDIAFVMDTTASMGGSITNLKNALSGTLLTQLAAAIPSVGLAVVDHRDVPYGGYGSSGDWPVKVRQVVTTNVGTAQAAVSQYAAAGGGDGPESQLLAMFHTLTGTAISWPTGSVPAHAPPAGYWGGVDFRPGSLAVVTLITDVSWHSDTSSPYSFSAPTTAQLQSAFQTAKARFVDITSGPEAQADALSDATGSNISPSAFGPSCAAGQCCTGVNGAARAPTGPNGSCRLNFLHSGGNGVSSGIVKAIEAISTGSRFDVTARASNDPSNAGGVDATKFIKALRAMEEGNATAGCPPQAATDTDGDGIKDTFVQVLVGTPVCFEVIAAVNQTVRPDNEAHFFNAFIDVLGVPGDVKLDRRAVLFLVPPAEPKVK